VRGMHQFRKFRDQSEKKYLLRKMCDLTKQKNTDGTLLSTFIDVRLVADALVIEFNDFRLYRREFRSALLLSFRRQFTVAVRAFRYFLIFWKDGIGKSFFTSKFTFCFFCHIVEVENHRAVAFFARTPYFMQSGFVHLISASTALENNRRNFDNIVRLPFTTT
jgi:hypothetical protein